MSYKGRYIVTNYKKYIGNPQKVIYRSLWERKFMVYCDSNPSIFAWASEEIAIPYLSPLDGKIHRYFSMRKWNGHFDGYDIWTNFAYKGDDNPQHNHAGMLSGVIYYKNHNHPTIFDEYNVGYEGLDGTMVMFPSQVLHHVEKQVVDTERITLAFNISRRDDTQI